MHILLPLLLSACTGTAWRIPKAELEIPICKDLDAPCVQELPSTPRQVASNIEITFVNKGSASLPLTLALSAKSDFTLEPGSLELDPHVDSGFVPTGSITVAFKPTTFDFSEAIITVTSSDDSALGVPREITVHGSTVLDGDGDSYDDIESPGGDDCNDLNPNVHPGADDSCYDGVDANCDMWSDFDCDRDGEDFSRYGGPDCDDADPTINTAADEIIGDGIDQDCDMIAE